MALALYCMHEEGQDIEDMLPLSTVAFTTVSRTRQPAFSGVSRSLVPEYSTVQVIVCTRDVASRLQSILK